MRILSFTNMLMFSEASLSENCITFYKVETKTSEKMFDNSIPMFYNYRVVIVSLFN